MIEVPSEDIRLLLESGFLYLAMGKKAEAKEIFEGVSYLAPESEVPLVCLGNVFFTEFKFAEAIKIYQKALKMAPQSAFAMAYLGESLFFDRKKEEALKVLKQASDSDPQGKSGDFARSLTEMIQKGFTPPCHETKQGK